MTYEELHNQMDVLMDKTTMPWLDPNQKDVYLNMALDDWPNWLYEEGFEKTARRRAELNDLVRVFTKANAKVIAKSEIDKLKYVVGVRAEFWFYVYDQNDNPKEEKSFVPVEVMSHDELGVAYVDPQRLPTDCFPFYTEYRKGDSPIFEIHSDNTPEVVEIAYLEDFGKIDGLNTPEGQLRLPDSVCRKIVQLATVKAQAGTQDPRYEFSNAELQRSA